MLVKNTMETSEILAGNKDAEKNFWYMRFDITPIEGTNISEYVLKVFTSLPKPAEVVSTIIEYRNTRPGKADNIIGEIPAIMEGLGINISVGEARRLLLDTIRIYDLSDKVNVFHLMRVNEDESKDIIPFWIPKPDRLGIRANIDDIKAVEGDQSFISLIHPTGLIIKMPVIDAKTFMIELESFYALDCYKTTTTHLINAQNLETVEELLGYNYKEGYPEIITKELPKSAFE